VDRLEKQGHEYEETCMEMVQESDQHESTMGKVSATPDSPSQVSDISVPKSSACEIIETQKVKHIEFYKPQHEELEKEDANEVQEIKEPEQPYKNIEEVREESKSDNIILEQSGSSS